MEPKLAGVADVLVIGYGNELRSDDGAGPAAARAVDALRLAGVRVLALPQLTPELAWDIAEAQAVIFVDARPAEGPAPVEVMRLTPGPARPVGSHASDPVALLSLAQTLYGRCPPAWLVAVAAVQFDLGTDLSAVTQAAVAEAVQRIRALCIQATAGRAEG